MKKTLTLCALAMLGLSTASAATQISQWDDFNNLTAGSLTMTVTGSSAVNDGVLTAVGASGGTATIDLSAQNLTMDGGLTVSLKVGNVRDFGGSSPNAIVALASSNSFLAFAGLNQAGTSAAPGFAFNSSANKVSLTTDVENGLAGVVGAGNSGLVTITITGTEMRTYLDGTLVAHATYSDATNTATTITKLALGSWAGASGNSRLTEDVYSLGIYNGAMTADEVAALSATPATPDPTPGTGSIPEPATATLSLLALAGLAARRRRK